MGGSLGYLVQENVDTGKREETDTFTCGHCNKMVLIKAKRAVIAIRKCGGCQRHVCAACHGMAKCDVIEKKLERIEARDRLLKVL